MPLSVGLDSAVSGLRVAQYAVDTAAHNIANADTDGYSRQEVMQRAVPPPRSRYGAGGVPYQQIGQGVEMSGVRRLRDTLLDTQYRDVRGRHDEFIARSAALDQTEVILNEPSDQGLQARLAAFFNSFRDLATQPESVAARAATIEQGVTLASAFNRSANMLIKQRDALDASLDVKVADINAKASELAGLNKEIHRTAVTGASANDLLDRRDLLLDDLAGLTGATSKLTESGMVQVFIGEDLIVDGVDAFALTTEPDPGNDGLRRIIFATGGNPAQISSGDVFATIAVRDGEVSDMIASLDELAGALIDKINETHRGGYGLNNATNLDFFDATGTTAATMRINADLRSSPESLATAARPDEPGNTDVAVALAAVRDAKLMNGATATLDDAYRMKVAQLGIASRQSAFQAENQTALLTHVDNARQSISGVSIDEEMTNLIKGQKAYQASARAITAIDEMLDTLINRTLR